MPFDITAFRAKLVGGGARPNMYEVILTAPPFVGLDTEQFAFMCQAASQPESTTGSYKLYYFGRPTSHGGDRTFSPWQCEIICDETFDLRNAMETWQTQIASHTTTNDAQRGGGATSAPNSYVGKATVNQYSKTGQIIKTYSFNALWPTAVGGIALGWSQNDTIEVFPVTFEYDYFTTNSVL